MKTLWLLPFLLTALVAATAGVCLAQGNNQPKWPTYKSKVYGYSVEYPPDWHRLAEGPSELDLVNYEPAHNDLGIVFNPSGHAGATPQQAAAEAELGVNVHPDGVATVEEWMIQDLGNNEPITKEEKINIARPVPSGCLALRRVNGITRVNGRDFADSYYYCTTKAGLYQVLLTYVQGNPHQPELDALALKMVLSLRVP